MAVYGVDDCRFQWEVELGLPWKNTEKWIKLSPFYQVEKVNTPILILSGEKDIRTPTVQSEQWYTALRRSGKTAQLVIYPEEGHGLVQGRNVVDSSKRQIEWFKKYLNVHKNGERGNEW